MKYLLKYSPCLVITVLLLSSFTSCRKEPSFDVVPHIEFRRFEESITVDQLGIKNHDIGVVVYFQDGDGNLGLSTTLPIDNAPPFDLNSPTYYNFFVKLFLKETRPDGSTEFVPYQFPQAGFDLTGRFPRISSDDRPETLEGEIKFTFRLSSDLFDLVGKTAKFDIYILDRALNRSNTVTSSEILLLP